MQNPNEKDFYELQAQIVRLSEKLAKTESALKSVDFYLDEFGCGYCSVPPETEDPGDVVDAVDHMTATLRLDLATAQNSLGLSDRELRQLFMAISAMAGYNVGSTLYIPATSVLDLICSFAKNPGYSVKVDGSCFTLIPPKKEEND